MSNPEQLLASFDAKIAEAKQRGDRMQAEMAAVSVAERSPDGQIAVKVNHLGNLVGLEIGHAVREKANLADEILRTVQRAQRGWGKPELPRNCRTGVPHSVLVRLLT